MACLLSGRVVLFEKRNTDTNTHSDDDQDQDGNTQAPPLELSPVASALDSSLDLGVGIAEVVRRLLGLLSHILDDGALLDDLLVEDVEKVDKVVDGLFNLHHVIVASADIAENFRGAARAVGAEGSLEDTLVTPVGISGLLQLGFGGVLVDDSVLAHDLLAAALSVGLLLLQELLDGVLEIIVETVELALLQGKGAVLGCRPLRIRLQRLDLVLDGRVLELRFGDLGVKLGLSMAVGAGQGSMVKRFDSADNLGQALNFLANGRHALEELVLGEDGS